MSQPLSEHIDFSSTNTEDACADALLAACGHVLVLLGEPVTPEAALMRANMAFTRVLEHAMRDALLNEGRPE